MKKSAKLLLYVGICPDPAVMATLSVAVMVGWDGPGGGAWNPSEALRAPPHGF